MKDFGFYLVMTDPVVGYAKCAEAAVKAHVKIVQLRMKHASRQDILREAREVRRVTSQTDTLFIVNDDPVIACEAGADGVHVGQSDMPVREIRERFPELKIIGLSTHNPLQTISSNDEPVDYIGVGPVHATPTKEIPDPTLGLETMRRMLDLAKRPAVAIGGINPANLEDVIRSGAKNYAVVRSVCRSPDPFAAISDLLDLDARIRQTL